MGTVDKAVRIVIEVVSVKLVDAHADRAGDNERIKIDSLVVEKAVHHRNGLVGKIAPYDTCVGNRIVRRANLRMQQQLGIKHRIRGEDHQIGGLFPLLIARVDERHSGWSTEYDDPYNIASPPAV